MARWTEEEEQYLRKAYARGESPQDIAQTLGRSPSAIRNRAYERQITKPVVWSAEELDMLEVWYRARAGKPLELDKLAAKLGRLKSNICRKAREIGLTDHRRTYGGAGAFGGEIRMPKFRTEAERRAHLSRMRTQWIAENGHPRGALGMKHTPDSLKKMAAASQRAWRARSPEEAQRMIEKANATKIARYGTGNPAMRNTSNPYSRARGGKRTDLNGIYFRSAWEANYARFLNFLKERGEIRDWEYEPEMFVFHGITRGALSYTPDFRVYLNGGGYEYREVKGWMDSKSKTRLKRMKKYYPDETVVIIGESEYKHITTHFAGAIPNWE